MLYKKVCVICNKDFETKFQNKNVCSFECKREKNRQASRRLMRINRHWKEEYQKQKNFRIKTFLIPKPPKCSPCIICGWDLTTDLHHEGRKTYQLCPNHHALITRGIKDIQEILKEQKTTC